MENINTFIALSNLLIAVLLAFVAWQNYKISEAGFYIQKDKLRLELFERRLRVYEACQNFCASISLGGGVDSKQMSKFLSDSSNAEFLFGEDISLYVDEIAKKSLKLFQIHRSLLDEKFNIEDTKKLAKEASDLTEWLDNQLQSSAKLFRKYLHFSIDRTP